MQNDGPPSESHSPPQAPPDPLSPPEATNSPRFYFAATLFYSIVLAAGTALLLFSAAQGRDQLLEDPARYLNRVLGRELDAAEVASKISFWERSLNVWLVPSRAEVLTNAIQTYRHFGDSGALPPETYGRTLAILLAESGNVSEAQRELEGIFADREDREFQEAFELAYMRHKDGPVAVDVSDRVSPAWARDQLQLRLALAQGDPSTADRVRARLESRGREQQSRTNILSLLHLVIVFAGLGALVANLKRRTGSRVAEGETISPWTATIGYAVLVRGAVLGIFLVGAVVIFSSLATFLLGFATLLSAIPMLWYTSNGLLKPHGRQLGRYFGLCLAPELRSRAFLWALAALALTILGEIAMGLFIAEPDPSSLVESIPEEFLFGTWLQIVLSGIDAIIWAPLVEEVVFRGIIYTTLRRHANTVTAATASAVLFAIVHGYSLQGFLVIWWSGFLWALVYEYTRSLWPTIICHSLGNGLALLSPLLLYRW